MRRKYYIGIDGGATKCKCRIEDQTGHLLGEATGGPSNIRLSVERSWASIHQAITAALAGTGLSLDHPDCEFYAGLALAGCEVKSAREAFLSHPHPFKHLLLKSDAYAACLGANAGEDGAIIIIGTGVAGMQTEKGKLTRVGGWGFPHNDEGGGAWIGLEAIRLTFQWRDGRIEHSPLVSAIYQKFHDSETALVAFANHADSTGFATLAPEVVEHAAHGDHHAVSLMRLAGQHIDSVAQALDRAASRSLPCTLFGGLAPFLLPWIGSHLRGRLKPEKRDAAAGAILMIRQHKVDIN